MRIYLFIAAIAGGVTYLITPLIRHIAIEIGAVGEVRARDVHTIPTPRLGGLGMLIGFTVSMLFASRIPFIQGLFAQSQQAWVILAGAVMISLLGMADDLWDLDWMLKLAGQLLISVVWMACRRALWRSAVLRSPFIRTSSPAIRLHTLRWQR